jgi:uncharacterized membrane protein HdeD (DUF308 family)
MFLFTGQALYVIAIAFGVWLIFSGVYRFMGAFAVPDENGWLRALWAILSVVSVAVGVYLLAHPILSLLVLTLTIGFFWVFSGMVELVFGVEYKGMPHRGWMIVGGILGIAGGTVIFFWPGISVLALALLLGIWLVAYGLTLVISSFVLRRHTSGVRAVLSPRHT